MLADAFPPAAPDTEALFELAVPGAQQRQVIVWLTLICRDSYRGVVSSCATCWACLSASALSTTCLSRPHGRRTSSTATRTSPAFGWARTNLAFFQFVHNACRRGKALLGTLVARLVA